MRARSHSTYPPHTSTQGFASASERFTQQAAAAPIAAPDYSSPSDGTTTTIMRGDQSRLGPGAYLQMVRVVFAHLCLQNLTRATRRA